MKHPKLFPSIKDKTLHDDIWLIIFVAFCVCMFIRVGSNNDLNEEVYVPAEQISITQLKQLKNKAEDKVYSQGYQKGAVDTYKLLKALKK